MPKEELAKFLKTLSEKIIKRELKAAGIPEDKITDYEVQLTEQDYKDILQDSFNFLVGY